MSSAGRSKIHIARSAHAAAALLIGLSATGILQAAQTKHDWMPYSVQSTGANCGPGERLMAEDSCCGPSSPSTSQDDSFLGQLGMIFNTSDFPPRWYCGTWSSWLGWLHIISDLAIFCAYVAIPAALIYFVRRRKDVPFMGLFLLFGAFIISCGITHLMEAVIFYWPAYRLAGFLKLITAIVSIATVIALFPIIPQALLLKSPAELKATVKLRTNELMAANDQLNRTVEQLDAARLVAEAATRAKSEFLANMSHEIRTPMTAILGFTDVILDGAGSDEAKRDSTDAARTIKRNGEHLLVVLNDILDLSKIEAGMMELELAPCCLRDLVENVVRLMSAKAQAAGLTLKSQIADELPAWIETDATRVTQILANLIGNAIKFTPSGSVTLGVSLGHSSETNNKLCIHFDIVDTGVGMSPEQATRIFNSFGQADASTTRKFGGTGLGLTISRKLARQFSGDLTLENTAPNKGSHFRLSLMAAVADADVASADGEIGVPKRIESRDSIDGALRGVRVLVAEDGIDNQRLIRLILSKSGAEVQIVENGQLAIDAVKATTKAGNGPHVLLMDMQMPVIDGYQATAALRAAGYSLPIIALTANAMQEDRQRCLDVGCSDYLSKPINRRKLFACIRSHLPQIVNASC